MPDAAKIVIRDGRAPRSAASVGFQGRAGLRVGCDRLPGGTAPGRCGGRGIDEMVMGCIGQVSADAFNARRLAITGVLKNVPAYTVNRLCMSGLQSIWSAAMQMRWGGVDLALTRSRTPRWRGWPSSAGVR